jgi:tetratricopeptide (TPR) repeat protein
MYRDSWDVLRRGDVSHAMQQMRENHEKEGSTSCAMELGVAYLWLGRNESALDVFDDYNRRYPNHVDCTYDMAGAAQWRLGRPDEAIASWRIGVDCDFKDAAGLGVRPALLLFFAAAIQSDASLRDDAEAILAERVLDPRISSWPGPVAQFLLGDVDERGLRALCPEKPFIDETPMNEWLADFYVGVAERSKGSMNEYQDAMKRCAELSWEDYDQDQGLFLSKMWSPEFFLAQYEAAAVRA